LQTFPAPDAATWTLGAISSAPAMRRETQEHSL
jgi:hypothetical protein